MKRKYFLGTVTFYLFVILSCYVFVKMRLTLNAMSNTASFSQSTISVKKDKMEFINRCRRRIESKIKITQKLWNSQYKSPCYHREGTLRCLPYFLVIGFPKCGTTDLFERMKHHPEFIPSKMKELHWLSRYRFMPLFRRNSTVQIEKYSPDKPFGLHLYTQMFDELATTLETSEGHSHAISADFSPSTIWDNDVYSYINSFSVGPEYYTQDFVHQLNPCMKLIVMMRDPVERLYSDYLFINGQNTAHEFHKKVKHVIKLYKSCLKLKSPRECFQDFNLARKSKIRLRIGAYSVFIQEWLKVFTRDQLYFVRMEDYVSNTKKVLEDIFNFLDMDMVSEDVMKRMLQQTPSNTRQSRGISFEPMYNKTHKLLSQFYGPFNHNLSMLLQNKDYTWHET
ncbi:carbohydrate sulfotransferase 15-like [Mytilus galloprovincialis]|uniref:carbohydrate sulfotransferase 15-like n=1 Tax=Mytilus galloprovincialis TaxID=29158 RepID=UPI003F7C5638